MDKSLADSNEPHHSSCRSINLPFPTAIGTSDAIEAFFVDLKTFKLHS